MIGNEYLANITGKDLLGYELLVQMVAASGALLFSRYDLFVVQPSYTNYQLHLGSMTSGNGN